jgi:hypothetical protein
MLNFYSILYAHIILFLIIIYIIIPLLSKTNLNAESMNLFTNFYLSNKFRSIIINFFIVYCILNISQKLPLNIPILYRRIIVILLYEVFLSIYINRTPFNVNYIVYLKEWSLSVGWIAILWDIFYINSTGYIADRLNIKSDNINLFIMNIIGFIILHQ